MAKIALTNYSSKELIELENEIEAALVQRAKAEKVELREKMIAMAAASGFTLDELMGGRTVAKRGGKGGTAAVKYRNPDNPSETWSGRGRMANWLKEKIGKRGVKIEDFAV